MRQDTALSKHELLDFSVSLRMITCVPVTNHESPSQVSAPRGPTNADAINIVKNEQLLKMQ